MSHGDVLISVQNVGVRFKARRSLFSRDSVDALRDVSFELRQGDSLGVIGRNGAGKSTLLKLLGGIIRPDSGTIVNNNASTALLSLQIGFDPELSGRVNAIVSGMLLGFRKSEVEADLDKIIEFSELGKFIDRPVKSYSTGMKARLGFSVALELSPDVLLVDEVLGVGDVQFREKSMAVMKEKLLSDQTIVLVSHSASTVKALCNQAVWIEDGVTKMVGGAAEVVTAYEKFIKESEHKLNTPKVFCIGFHRTGNSSVAKALSILGYSVTGPNGVKDPEIINKLHELAKELCKRHDAFQDNPWPILFREIDKWYPGSRFILTTRSTEEWVKSIVRHFGKGSTPMRELIYGVGCPKGNEEIYIARYKQHNAEVIEYFKNRPNDLLVLDIDKGEGWEELCPFLKKDNPGVNFP